MESGGIGGAGGIGDNEDPDGEDGGHLYGVEPGTDIVLAEDKKYYPTAEEVYGADTETLVMEEDAQPIETPIIARAVTKQFDLTDEHYAEVRIDIYIQERPRHILIDRTIDRIEQ